MKNSIQQRILFTTVNVVGQGTEITHFAEILDSDRMADGEHHIPEDGDGILTAKAISKVLIPSDDEALPVRLPLADESGAVEAIDDRGVVVRVMPGRSHPAIKHPSAHNSTLFPHCNPNPNQHTIMPNQPTVEIPIAPETANEIRMDQIADAICTALDAGLAVSISLNQIMSLRIWLGYEKERDLATHFGCELYQENWPTGPVTLAPCAG